MKILIKFILSIILVLTLTTYTGCSKENTNNSAPITNNSEKDFSETFFTESTLNGVSSFETSEKANNSTSITNSSEKDFSETSLIESTANQISSSEISENDVLLILEKAEELYKSSDGINGFEFQKVANKYYQNGDVNKPTYDDIIAEYHKIFTDNVCQQIFSGKRKKDNTEYEVIPVYGFSSDGNYINLDFSEDSNTYKNCEIINLFSSVRGMDMNYVEHYFKVNEITNDKIAVSCMALYSKNPDGFNLSVKYKNNNWIITKSENTQQIGNIYELSSYEYTKDYFYSLILEDGKWKLENFELWY